MSATTAAGKRNGKIRVENQNSNSTMPSKKLPVMAKPHGIRPSSSRSSKNKSNKKRENIKENSKSFGSRTTRSLRSTRGTRGTLDQKVAAAAEAERILRSAKVFNLDENQNIICSHFSPTVLTKSLGRGSIPSSSSPSPIEKSSEAIKKTKPTFTAAADKINPSRRKFITDIPSKSIADFDLRSRERPPGPSWSSNIKNNKKGDKIKKECSSGSRIAKSLTSQNGIRSTLIPKHKVVATAKRILRSAKLSGDDKINSSRTKSISAAASDPCFQPKVIMTPYYPKNKNPLVVSSAKKSVSPKVNKSEEQEEPTPSTSAGPAPSPNINQCESENLSTPTLSSPTLSTLGVGNFTELSTSDDDTSSLFGDEIGHCKPMTKRSINSRKLKPESLDSLLNHIIRNTESPEPEPVILSPSTRFRRRPRRNTCTQSQHKHPPSEIYGLIFSKTIS